MEAGASGAKAASGVRSTLRSSIGAQPHSHKRTEPAHRFPKAPRDQRNHFISHEHSKTLSALGVPAPSFAYSSFGSAGAGMARADGRHLKGPNGVKFSTAKRFDYAKEFKERSLGPGPAKYAN